jgi:3-dehydroquinate synthase
MGLDLPPVTVRFARAGAYEVRFDSLASIADHAERVGLEPRSALIVTDSNVGPLYLAAVREAMGHAGWRVRAVEVPAGEASKSAAVIESIYGAAGAAGLERSDAIVALGGGVVGDLAGFAAATWLRGVPLVQAPTTLLAQCDSSIGGKNGINHAGGKNLVGTIWPPRLVLSDIATLDTLKSDDFAAGLSEVAKHAILDGPAAVDALIADWAALLARDSEKVGGIVRRAAAFKAEVVSEDEMESGRRAFLNLGHTFAHAIESAGGPEGHTHGQAVALGLRAALHLSASLAAGRPLPVDCTLPEPFGRSDDLAARLPTGPPLEAPVPALEAALVFDKKRGGGALRFVTLDSRGRPQLTRGVPAPMISAAWRRARACSLSPATSLPAEARR